MLSNGQTESVLLILMALGSLTIAYLLGLRHGKRIERLHRNHKDIHDDFHRKSSDSGVVRKEREY